MKEILEKEAYKMTLLLKQILNNETMQEKDKHTLSQQVTNTIIFLLDLRKHFKKEEENE